MRESTFQKVTDLGFDITLGGVTAGGMHECGHELGPHRLVASFGSPLDGGLYYCQEYPGCLCTGTWGTTCPEGVKEKYRGL